MLPSLTRVAAARGCGSLPIPHARLPSPPSIPPQPFSRLGRNGVLRTDSVGQRGLILTIMADLLPDLCPSLLYTQTSSRKIFARSASRFAARLLRRYRPPSTTSYRYRVQMIRVRPDNNRAAPQAVDTSSGPASVVLAMGSCARRWMSPGRRTWQQRR